MPVEPIPPTETPARKPLWLRLLPLAILAGGLAAFFALGWHRYISFETIKSHRAVLMEWVSRWGMMAAANVQHQTGRLWSRQIRPAGLGFPSPPTINMESNTGDRRVPDVDLLDLRLQKTFTIGGAGTRIDVFLDGLNMTNSDSSESVASQLGAAAATAFGVPTRYTYPRRLQLGAKVRW